MIGTRMQRNHGKQKTANRAQAASTATLATVDYPQADEVVTSPRYTIRIGAIKAAKVEVFIDAGPWKPCRSAAGYWWYDWSDYLPGKHLIKAQALTEDGQLAASRSHLFTVAPAPSAN